MAAQYKISILLKKLQNEAAHIVTGLTRSVSLDNLYRECSWVSHAERRRQQKLIFMYNSTNGRVPTYVADLISPSFREISTYTLRNQHNIVPFCRIEISRKSCIPSSISEWNSLDVIHHLWQVLNIKGGGRVWRRCRISYVSGASS